MGTVFRSSTVCFFGLLILFGGLGVSCSDESVEFKASPYTFDAARVDSLRSIKEMDLSFAPPLGWRIFDSTALDYFGKMLARTDLTLEFYPIFPVAGANDSATKSVMYIAEIEERSESITTIADDYEDYLTERLKEDDELTRAAYRINDLNIHSYLVKYTGTINYKLIGETAAGRKFLVEYVIRAPVYPMMKPAIFSSIASLRSAR